MGQKCGAKMWNRLNLYRMAVFGGIALLMAVLVVMATSLFSQLRTLSTANNDNMLWSMSQLDTEFANLNATLSDRVGGVAVSDDEVRLRVDIALSRLGVISSGRAASLLSGTDEGQAARRALDAFSSAAIEISDRPGALTPADIVDLRNLTLDVRPVVKSVSLLGVEVSAKNSEQRRADFSSNLARTGGIAIFLLVLLAVLMLVLARLMHSAIKRDADLVTSSRLLESTVAASLDAIVTSNEAGEIIGYNEAAETVFGWTRDEMLGATMENSIIPHRFREAHNAGMTRYLKTREPRVVDAGRVELAALRKSGEEFPIELNITSVESKDGSNFIAYLRDISDRKINEQKLIEARDRAERTDKAKSQFLTVMSHEMRTPLNGILGVLDLLKNTKLTKPQSRYADIAIASSEILLEHINEALDITRIETGTLQLTPQDFDLPETVNQLVEVLEPLAREKQLGLSLEISDSMRVGFHGDYNRVRQILTNLIGNAIKFTDHGTINIKVDGIHGVDVSSVKFAVTDSGPGIDGEHQEQIFEDFVALSNSEGRQSRGDGLGLSISRKIARQMGGDISVKSQIGKGSTFTLTVPLSLVKKQSVTRSNSRFKPKDVATPDLNILVVEDNNINRKVLRDMLHGLGHSVTEAVDGVDSLQKAETQKFDLIFMDISMPNMDGIEATQRLRQDGGPNAETEIFGLTAHGREEYREQAETAGMSGFHTKPIRLKVLRTILSKVSEGTAYLDASPELPDELMELCAALGKDKVHDIGQKFFDEVQDFVDQVRSGALPPNSAALAESAHKNKGAAALLGQASLQTPFADLEQAARAKSVQDLQATADKIENTALIARKNFTQAIQ